MSDRGCGGCTMCCKLLGIDELQKPRNVWCQHCNIGRGCGIYASRPPSCAAFECLWLQNPCIPDDARPDKTGVVIFLPEDGSSIQVHVDPHKPNSWKSGDTGMVLNALAQEHPVLVTIGNQRKFLGTETMWKDIEVRLGPDIVVIDEGKEAT